MPACCPPPQQATTPLSFSPWEDVLISQVLRFAHTCRSASTTGSQRPSKSCRSLFVHTLPKSFCFVLLDADCTPFPMQSSCVSLLVAPPVFNLSFFSRFASFSRHTFATGQRPTPSALHLSSAALQPSPSAITKRLCCWSGKAVALRRPNACVAASVRRSASVTRMTQHK